MTALFIFLAIIAAVMAMVVGGAILSVIIFLSLIKALGGYKSR